MGNLPIPEIFYKIPKKNQIIVCPECNKIASIKLSRETDLSQRKIQFLCCLNKEYNLNEYLKKIILQSPEKPKKLINPFPTLENQKEFEKIVLSFFKLAEKVNNTKVNQEEYNLFLIYSYLISNAVYYTANEKIILNVFNNCIFDFIKTDFGKSASDIVNNLTIAQEWNFDFSSNVNIIQVSKRFFAFCDGRKCTFINFNQFSNYSIKNENNIKNNEYVIKDCGYDYVNNIIMANNKVNYLFVLGKNSDHINYFYKFEYDSEIKANDNEIFIHIFLIKSENKNQFITITKNESKKYSNITKWIFYDRKTYGIYEKLLSNTTPIISSEDCVIQSINGNLIIGFEDFKIRIFSIETLQNISYLNLYTMKPLKIIEVDDNSILISIMNKGVIKLFLDYFDNDYCYLEGSEKENKKMCLVGNNLCIMDKNQINIIGINIKKKVWTLEFENEISGNYDIFDIGSNQFIIKTSSSLTDKEINIKHFNIQKDENKVSKIIIMNEEDKDDEDNEFKEQNQKKSFFGKKKSSKLGLSNIIDKKININAPPIIFNGNLLKLREQKTIHCQPDFVHNLLIFKAHLLTSLSNKVALFEKINYYKVFEEKFSEEEIINIIKIDEDNIALILFHGSIIINFTYDSSKKKFNYKIIQNINYDEGFYNGLLLSNNNLFFGTYDGKFLFYKLKSYDINQIVSLTNTYEKIYEFKNIQNVYDMQFPGFLDLKNGKLLTWMLDDKIIKIINYESLEIIKLIKDYPIYDGCLINEKYAILKLSEDENEEENESNLLTLLFDIEKLIITQKFTSSVYEYGVLWIDRNKYISFNEEDIFCYIIEENNGNYNHKLLSKKKIVNNFNEKIRHILIWNISLLFIVRNNETISILSTS